LFASTGDSKEETTVKQKQTNQKVETVPRNSAIKYSILSKTIIIINKVNQKSEFAHCRVEYGDIVISRNCRRVERTLERLKELDIS